MAISLGQKRRRNALCGAVATFAFLATIGSGTSLSADTWTTRPAPETPPNLGAIASSPLLDLVNRPQSTTEAPANAFDRLADGPAVAPIVASTAIAPDEGALAGSVEASASALAIVESAPQDPTATPPVPEPASAVPAAAEAALDPPPVEAPTRSQSPAPSAAATALFEAVERLILSDGVNPLGQGDWRAARAAIGAFYADRRFEPVWLDQNGLTEGGRAVTAQLGRASEDGLNLASAPLPRKIGERLTPAEAAKAEVAIAVAVVTYAEQASGSRINPLRISPLITAAPSLADPAAALADTAAAPDPGARLANFNPTQPGYRALREELKRLESTSDRPVLSRTRAVLDLEGDLVVTDLTGGADAAPLVGAAKRRLKGSGRNAAFTAAADAERLSSARQRRAILANMEMWRWEPRDMGDRRIEINVPDYSVAVIDGDAVVHRARVVVGKPDTPTPIFSNVMRYVLINPSWQVPDSIIKKEILPRLSHFERLGYEVKTVGGRTIVRQPPGGGNALGRIAFMFPNDHAVYLHDTPSRELFNEDMRALSHGCVRVEEPVQLAELVLGWPESRIEGAIGGPERTVFLPKPLPIHIEYFTEFVDESGGLQERPDVYGLTQKVADTLSRFRQD